MMIANKFCLVLYIVVVGFVSNRKTYAQDPCSKIVRRRSWAASKARTIEYFVKPAELVIVHHTASKACDCEYTCINKVKNLQNYAQKTLFFRDIPYNFIIGGDGRAYEGAGWHTQGSHTSGYNNHSISIAFIGNFEEQMPAEEQLQAAQDLLICGLIQGELGERYKLVPARFLKSTLSPGVKLLQELKNWPHFSVLP